LLYYLSHIFILFLTVQLAMDDDSSETCIVFIKTRTSKTSCGSSVLLYCFNYYYHLSILRVEGEVSLLGIVVKMDTDEQISLVFSVYFI